MREFERQFTEVLVENLSTSIANSVREGGNIEALVEDEGRLSDAGRMYVRGYVTGRLTMLRAGTDGNPNLSAEDLDQVDAIVEGNEGAIAAALCA